MTYTITRVGQSGWYNFTKLPQGYIEVHNLYCGTDRKAIRYARERILNDKTATILVESVSN